MTAAPFRYWGSKVRMAPWIIERLPAHNHYIEGCAGSAAVLANKPPVDTETLNDTYGEVVNFFRVLRDPATAAELIDLVAFTPYSYGEFLRAGDVLAGDVIDGIGATSDGPVHRAWALFVRMQMAVVPGRSGWSFATDGANGKKANKPGRWATMPAMLQAACVRFERVQVEQRPVVDLIDRYDKPGVLFFIDPPYTDESRPTSTGASSAYADDEFNHPEFLAASRG